VRREAGDRVAASLPYGYQRLGRVLVLRLPEAARPYYSVIGEAWRAELGVETVLVRTGPIEGELRTPRVERIAGSETETEVIEHGIRWRFDAAEIMFAAGNRVERVRAGTLVRPGEVVADLFAGIGYFAIPAAVRGHAREVVAVDKNPVAIRYLTANAESNGVGDRVRPVLGENRTAPLPLHAYDRVFLGYLPSALPWVPRALELVRPEGGWIHVHTIADAHGGLRATRDLVAAAVLADGGDLLGTMRSREVKPYGPGRTHVVVDAPVRPRSPARVTPPGAL
jgi:tRNA wybutosine-synthesizing protein 2